MNFSIVRLRTPNPLPPYVPPIHLGRGEKKNWKEIAIRKRQPLQERSPTRENTLTFENELLGNYNIVR